MRIGIDARLNGYRGGGISEYTRHLIQALATFDSTSDFMILHAARAQRDNAAIAAEGLTPAANFKRVEVFTPPHHKLERWILSGELLPHRLDVLHSPDFIPPRWGAKRKVITVHDLNFVLYPKFQTPDSLRYYSGYIRSAVHKADHILAVSQSCADDLCNLLDVPSEKISVQGEGVGTDYGPMPGSAVDAVRGRLNLPREYILFVGTFEPRKNLPGLFDAYHRLHQTTADVPPLVLVGRRGWLYEPIFQKVAELGLDPYLIWLEDLPMADLPAVYCGASMLVLPSFYEGFGLPALEAMACGTPVIVSNRGSLPEVVADAGLFVDPDLPENIAEAIRQMLDDSDLRARCRELGLSRAAHYTWQHAAEIALDVYRKVMS
jgi:glycosyltransferase involved in cell wall biosynthesis